MKNFTNEEFVRVWQSSSTPVEAAKKLGGTPKYVSQKAAWMRKNGVPLKKYKGHQILDVDGLTKLVNSLGGR